MRKDVEQLLQTGRGVIVRRDHPDLAYRLDALARRGQLAIILPGVLVVPELVDDVSTRIMAACHWASEGTVIGRAAAKVSFLPDLKVETIAMAVSSGRRGRPGFELTRRIIPPEQMRHQSSVRYTSPALTALDLVPDLGGDAIDRVLRSGAVALDDLWQAMSPNRRGNPERLLMLLDSRDRPWSAAERRSHRLLRGAGITGWDTNAWVQLPEGGYFLDVAFRQQMVALEIDGWEYHGKYKSDFEKTWRRHNALVAAGWRVLHITWQQLVEEPAWVLDKVRQVLSAPVLRMS